MNDKLNALIEYQKNCLKLQDLESEKKGCLEEEMEAQQILNLAKKRLEEKLQQAKKEQAAVASRDSELTATESKIAQLKAKLNTIRKQAEYDAVCAEIRGLEAEKSAIEDDILKAMTNLDITQAEIKSIKEEIKAAENNLSEIRKQTEGIIRDLDARIQEQKALCEKQKAAIPPDTMNLYERLRARYGSKTIVPVTPKQDADKRSPHYYICRGCNTKVTLQQVNVLLRGDTLVFCSSCGRIQYLDQSQEE